MERANDTPKVTLSPPDSQRPVSVCSVLARSPVSKDQVVRASYNKNCIRKMCVACLCLFFSRYWYLGPLKIQAAHFFNTLKVRKLHSLSHMKWWCFEDLNPTWNNTIVVEHVLCMHTVPGLAHNISNKKPLLPEMLKWLEGTVVWLCCKGAFMMYMKCDAIKTMYTREFS